jgi:hypothetical protein
MAAQQEAQKASGERERASAQVAKTQQELKSAVVERERLQSQLEMLVNELSNRQVYRGEPKGPTPDLLSNIFPFELYLVI